MDASAFAAVGETEWSNAWQGNLLKAASFFGCHGCSLPCRARRAAAASGRGIAGQRNGPGRPGGPCGISAGSGSAAAWIRLSTGRRHRSRKCAEGHGIDRRVHGSRTRPVQALPTGNTQDTSAGAPGQRMEEGECRGLAHVRLQAQGRSAGAVYAWRARSRPGPGPRSGCAACWKTRWPSSALESRQSRSRKLEWHGHTCRSDRAGCRRCHQASAAGRTGRRQPCTNRRASFCPAIDSE